MLQNEATLKAEYELLCNYFDLLGEKKREGEV